MKEPRRLLSHGATDFERRLLESMRSERPGPQLRSRMQQGLGIAGPLLWASNVKAMLSDVATKTFGGGKLLGAKVAFGPMGMAAASTVAAGGIALAVGFGPADPAPIPRQVPVQEAVSRPSVPQHVATPVERTAPQHEAALANEAPSNALREEISLLDGARAALAAGDTKRAATLLKEHREGFPKGLLLREAKLLRQRLQRAASAKSGPRRPASMRRTPASEPP